MGTGTVLTRDVPAGALAIARAKQAVKEGWAKRLRQVSRSTSNLQIVRTMMTVELSGKLIYCLESSVVTVSSLQLLIYAKTLKNSPLKCLNLSLATLCFLAKSSFIHSPHTCYMKQATLN